jgi:hypothetical protein
MAKATFVRNCLFNGKVSLADLGFWVLDQEDLEDQVWEGGSDGYSAMIEVPAPDEAESDGKTWYRADPDGLRVIVRIQMETLHGGESKLLRRERRPWEDYCDD